MKIRVCTERYFDIETDEKIFETLHSIYEKDVDAIVPNEQLEKAISIIEKMTGIPTRYGYEDPDKEYIYAVYDAEDDVILLDC